MADGTIAIDEGVADKLVDTEELTVAATVVQRERIRVTGVLAAELAAVLNSDPASTVYGLIVRDVRGSATATPTFTDPIDRALRDMGKIDIAGFDVALPAGTANIGDVDIASFVAGAITEVQGDVAHDAVNAGNPVQVGHEAIAHGTNPTAVAAGDSTKLYANRAGIPYVLGGHPNIITRRDNFTAAQTDVALVTIAGGLKIVVTRISVLADKANTVDVAVRVGFGLTTTPAAAGVVLSHPGIAAGSGVVEGNGAGMLGVGADGEDLRITSEVPTGGSIDVVMSYFTVES